MNAPSRRALCRILLGAPVLSAISPVNADDYPSKPIHLVVPVPAGGPNDFSARIVGDVLSRNLGQPFVVDNKVGAGGILGAEFVAKQPPDGYTILETALTHVVSPSLGVHINFDPIKGYTAIGGMVTTSFVLVVNARSQIQNVAQFVAALRAKPGLITYGTPGQGTPHQLATELLTSKTGTKANHVPYRGANEIIPALLGGQVDFTIIATFGVLQLIRDGQLRALAVVTAGRDPDLPDTPTLAESLSAPDFEVKVWQGMLGPANMPPAIVTRLNGEIGKALQDPDVASKLRALGLRPWVTTPKEFEDTMLADMQKWSAVLKNVAAH
jgi:tripartite-type tricarboxylate transporter receptor subunit TctC